MVTLLFLSGFQTRQLLTSCINPALCSCSACQKRKPLYFRFCNILVHGSVFSLSVCIRLNAAEVDRPNYGLSFKINMKPLGWFMQPGSWAIETSKRSMRQCWRLKPCNQRAFIVERLGKQRSECCLHPLTWDKTQQEETGATKPTSSPAQIRGWAKQGSLPIPMPPSPLVLSKISSRSSFPVTWTIVQFISSFFSKQKCLKETWMFF